jgi:hypothetical protein
MIWESDGKFDLFVSKFLSDLVEASDLQLIQSLVQDFLIRAQEDGDDLFRQLSSLVPGPLTTIETGDDPARNERVLRLKEEFVGL